MSIMPGPVTKAHQFARLDSSLSTNPHFFEHRYDTQAEEILVLLEEAVRDGVLDNAMRNHIKNEWVTQLAQELVIYNDADGLPVWRTNWQSARYPMAPPQRACAFGARTLQPRH